MPMASKPKPLFKVVLPEKKPGAPHLGARPPVPHPVEKKPKKRRRS
jgi:hypothetical protein